MDEKNNYSKSVAPTYEYMFDFEKKFIHHKTREWMLNYWTSGFYLCALYVCLIFAIQFYMRNRPKYNLKKVLVVWNTCLAVFSILGASRTLPELVYVLKNFGIYHSVCIQRKMTNLLCKSRIQLLFQNFHKIEERIGLFSNLHNQYNNSSEKSKKNHYESVHTSSVAN